MGRSRQLGMILMAAAGLNGLIMVIGTMRRSYLAIQVRQDNLANHILVLLLRYF